MTRSLIKAAAFAAAQALAACSHAEQDIGAACAALSAADRVFQDFAAAGKVAPADQKAEAEAMAGVKAFCTPPYAQNTAAVIADVVSATVAVASLAARYKSGQ
ncbi:MAG: hypothetical protein ACHQF3_08580 [Alphaproteobacteria bacterium]